MSKRIVTLIGGEFHREKVEINEREHTIRMAKRPFTKPVTFENPHFDEIEFLEYGQVVSVLGEYDIIPDNVFILKSLNPVEFLRNLVKDYVKC